MISLDEFIKRYGWFGFVRLAFYPITNLITTPVRLIQTLWACRILLDGRWGKYPHVSSSVAINSLFYWTRAISLYRFGRAGKASYLGLGNTSLAGLFFYSLPSLYMFWMGSIPTVLLGLAGWWLSNLIWLQSESVLVIIIVMGLALISTLFYVNIARQNYNIISWFFFPVGLYGLITGHWAIAGIAWVLAGFGGITVVFVGGIYSVFAAILYGSLFPILAFIPACLFLVPQFWPLLFQGEIGNTILLITKAIGAKEQKAKYRRVGLKRFDISVYYFLFLCIQYLAFVYFLSGNIPVFFLIGIFIFFVNSTFFRFADTQSMYMLMLSLGVCTTILEFHPLLLISYWLLISPLPKLILFPTHKNILDIVPLLAPFDIQPLMDGMENFLSPVQKGQRVLMAYQDPGGVYENIFDGYRVLLELPLYVSAMKEIHFMPDWWAVAQLNYEGAPDFWGREIDQVLKNVRDWHADYVVVYQESKSELHLKWQQAGFNPLSKFSWSNYAESLQGALVDSKLPDWWIMEVPQNKATIE